MVRELSWRGCYSKQLKGAIHDEAFSHPAKFSAGLIKRIYEHGLERGYWQEGDLIADPFAGVGIGGIFAAAYGLGWIGVELEQKFVDLANKSFGLHYDAWDKMGKPRPIIVQGDSREFASIVRQAINAVVTSPPYAESWHSTGQSRESMLQRVERGQMSMEAWRKATAQCESEGYGATPGQIGAMKEGKLDEVVAVITSPPYSEIRFDGGDAYKPDYRGSSTKYRGEAYGQSEGQLGGMPEGDHTEVVDSIITSPPYSHSMSSEKSGIDWSKCKREDGRPRDMTKEPAHATRIGAGGEMRYSPSPNNVGNLPEGDHGAVISGIVTSPPYADSMTRGGHLVWREQGKVGAHKDSKGKSEIYSADPANMGNLPEGNHGAVVNGIVTSPPYERSMDSIENAEARAGRADGFTQGMKTLKYGENPYGFLSKDPSGLSNEERHRLAAQNPQIGQKQGDTYWAAVAQVYSECFKTLRPNGIIVVVVKDFVRQGQRIPLCDQTFELLQAIGFKPLERIRAWLVSEAEQKSLMPELVKDYRKERKSFFRRLAERKGSPKINWEEVLICQKVK